ncbi:MAG: protein-L-isoaspartate(D-aspartate) O-methyltransferase [Flavobacteriaceae bacterium]|nr:protein-L-isoaspartate(D-aspartate) O-methyltransferase [Flavobacteriaceae bacterium]|tara:strand:- start:184 stop:825 length:642 start_codon:yes stop_codon:yes gene_type:complete
MQDTIKYQGLRKQLIELLKDKGIIDTKVLEVMGSVPRHFFMDPGLINFAYEDNAYPIAADQTISQPYTVAYQSELLQLSKFDKVLEIGTGSGYQTAILLGITSQVYTVERQQILFKKTQLLFQKMGLRPKKHLFGDGYLGYEKAAPFDRIVVTAAAPEVPRVLLNQLKIGGKLIIPLGEKDQFMMRFTKTGPNLFDKEKFGRFRFVPLLENKN